VIRCLLADPSTERELVSDLQWRQVVEADFDRQVPTDLDAIRGFEDCSWLFESSAVNYSLSQLRFDEAADLYRRVAHMESPRVAELGRYKGGTTLLLAAAGGHVVSLDNDAAGGQPEYDEALHRALRRFRLEDRAEVLLADALEYDLERESFDLVLLHCSPDYELAWGLFRRWWPAVKPGGCFVFHVTPALPGEVRMVDELRRDPRWPDLAFEPEARGEQVYARKAGGVIEAVR